LGCRFLKGTHDELTSLDRALQRPFSDGKIAVRDVNRPKQVAMCLRVNTQTPSTTNGLDTAHSHRNHSWRATPVPVVFHEDSLITKLEHEVGCDPFVRVTVANVSLSVVMSIDPWPRFL
jgi:hypothetical protein